MNLFRLGKYTLSSGGETDWKIDCDALTDEDWIWAATKIRSQCLFSEVHGVPTGGSTLAEILQSVVVDFPVGKDFNSLIVDDVYTTGASMRKLRDELILRPDGGGKRYIGYVLFARTRINPADNWITPLFQFYCG